MARTKVALTQENYSQEMQEKIEAVAQNDPALLPVLASLERFGFPATDIRFMERSFLVYAGDGVVNVDSRRRYFFPYGESKEWEAHKKSVVSALKRAGFTEAGWNENTNTFVPLRRAV